MNLWYLKCKFFKVCSKEGILVPGYLIFIEQWTLIQCSYLNVIKIWGWNKKFSEQIIYEAEYKCWKYRFNFIGESRLGMVFIASLMTCWQCNCSPLADLFHYHCNLYWCWLWFRKTLTASLRRIMLVYSLKPD